MRFVFNTKELQNALKKLAKVSPVKEKAATMMILFEGDKEEKSCTLTANNTRMGIQVSVPAKVSDTGTAALSTKLHEIVAKLTGENITIEVADGKAVIKSGKAKFQISPDDPAVFITIPSMEGGKEFTFNGEEMKECLSGVMFAAGLSESNQMMSNVCFESDVSGQKISLTALDGHRIASRKCNCFCRSDERIELQIPVTEIKEVSKLLDGEVTARITEKGNLAEFMIGDTKIVTNTFTKKKYFNVNQMFNSDFPIRVMVLKDDLIEVLDRAIMFEPSTSQEHRKPVIISIENQNMRFRLKTNIGQMDEAVSLSEKKGPDLDIAFNSKLLIEIVKAVPDDELIIELQSAKAPVLFQGEDYRYLILPVSYNPGK